VYSGNSTSFWHDRWLSAIPLKVELENLYRICSFQDALVKDVLCPSSHPPWNFSFSKPLIGPSFRQLALLYAGLSFYNIDSELDILIWCWDRSSRFSSNSFYRFLNFSGVSSTIFKHVWKSNTPLKAKLHMWLIIHKKLNTIELLKKNNLSLLDNCAFCCLSQEDISHIYFEYPITSIFYLVLFVFFISAFPLGSPTVTFLGSFRFRLGRASRYLLDILFTIICWYI